jgi:hypothetical protein
MKDGSPQLTKALALYQSLHQAPKFKSTSSFPYHLANKRGKRERVLAMLKLRL